MNSPAVEIQPEPFAIEAAMPPMSPASANGTSPGSVPKVDLASKPQPAAKTWRFFSKRN